jgi:hypothetical protein
MEEGNVDRTDERLKIDQKMRIDRNFLVRRQTEN